MRQENLQRKRVKRLLSELSAEHPQVKGNLFHALGNVVPSHLLDRELLASAKGKDPWVSEGEDVGGCATAAKTQNVLLTLKASARR